MFFCFKNLGLSVKIQQQRDKTQRHPWWKEHRQRYRLDLGGICRAHKSALIWKSCFLQHKNSSHEALFLPVNAKTAFTSINQPRWRLQWLLPRGTSCSRNNPKIHLFQGLRDALKRLPSQSENVVPQRTEVTHEESVNVLVEIYASCLQGKGLRCFSDFCKFATHSPVVRYMFVW